jgi:CubicO group peptidase (beta-lactamase class C family)
MMRPPRLAAAFALACTVGLMGPSPGALKPLDPVALQATVEATAKELLLPGAMVLLRTPQGEFAFGYGTVELAAGTPPRADTHFRAASNTKTMTAAMIVLLAQEGKLRFEDPISKYVERVPNGDNITISDLLKMRSGLYNYTSAPELAQSLDNVRPRFGHRTRRSPSRSSVSLSSPRARSSTTATPTMSCSVSWSRSSKARLWHASFRIVCWARSA